MIFLNDLKPFGIYTHDFRKKTQCAFMNFDSMCCRAECRILRADARARTLGGFWCDSFRMPADAPSRDGGLVMPTPARPWVSCGAIFRVSMAASYAPVHREDFSYLCSSFLLSCHPDCSPHRTKTVLGWFGRGFSAESRSSSQIHILFCSALCGSFNKKK